MTSLFNSLFRKKKKAVIPEKLNSATAVKVLKFLSHGLVYGAQSLGKHYPPQSKVNEFVAVSGAILKGLQPGPDATPRSDSVVISVHVNNAQKHIKFMQVGEHVVLVLDGCEHIISLTTLDQIYSGLRNDMINHEEIYGRSLMLAASRSQSRQ